MTIAEIKRDLPQVQVKIGKKKVWARISGRLNQFATVSLGYSTAAQTWVDFSFSWEAIAHSLNSGKPLLV